ncbi:DEAD/DEAH box helicase family protein [Branchiibius sp. NY16-3462-2]|uniref:DEAD/DEAH box helicase family protein n=1 Tax=Branchiibius sp. NY16-3462-2 TaxID=1807500 RepID=UPI0007970111|nr:DEAD/DEAH box helicase family protein [Branchiibius sp. NY16-3462-2]KYH43989.1 restriction endonuclease subunit R [Branchiibius sp. NY16-3462-2]
MTNFYFVRQTLPSLYEDCGRAESYLASDPRAACVYARRVVELLVDYLYDVADLPEPYKSDLAARIAAPGFKNTVGQGITAKLTLIRKVGNSAVHESTPVSKQVALQVLRDLHHVVAWTAFHHSPDPQAVPMSAPFDPKLAAQAAPLSRDEVVKLAARFKAQDEAHAKALADKDELLKAHEAQIAVLQAQIKAAQKSALPDERDYTEAQTRDSFIDVLLGEAGWPLDEAKDREYPVTGMPGGGKGFVDYVLWGADGLPLAVVEAKRTMRDAKVGQQQAKLYADCLEAEFGRRPIIFYTNGYEHFLWDDAAGYPPRAVAGFYTRDELELMIQRRTTRQPLTGQPVNAAIAGRPYQMRAIQAVDATLDERQRDALLVMATGSGKTRVVIALIDQLTKANWVKRVLFLADRVALAGQAARAFRSHLPHTTTVNLAEERRVDGRVYVSTYQTMIGLIDEVDDAGRRFGPGYFDLIVIDEAHRSVYAKYGAIFEYFDALLVGLTATPKDEVDRNTYRLFHLEDGVPTDSYSLEEAVFDGYLAPPRAVRVGTKFLREGIRYDDLSDAEKDEWDALDWGDDGPPTEVDAEALNRFLFNEDTVDKVLETLMTLGYKVAGGERLGKTIIFAKNQKHADFIEDQFNTAYPQYAGNFARTITFQETYAQSLIDDFSVKDKPPHIAISVDMLDTGIDVPEVLNLVFLKTIHSKTKFWQMIGRGTRLCPDVFGPGEDKQDFFVFDFCGNFEFFSQNPPVVDGSTQKSLSQRIFETRLDLLSGLDRDGLGRSSVDGDDSLRTATAHNLHETVAGMTMDNFQVRPHRRAVDALSSWPAWNEPLRPETFEDARSLSGLPSTTTPLDGPEAKSFDLLVLRRMVADLDGDQAAAESLRAKVQLIAGGLLSKLAIPAVAAQKVLLESAASDEWWIDVSLEMLELLRLRVRGLVQFLDKTHTVPVYTDFEDTVSPPDEVAVPGVQSGVDLERFRSKAEAYLRAHLDNVALERLRRNRQLTPHDIVALEDMLVASGAGPKADVGWVSERAGGLGIFVRGLVGLERDAAQAAFAQFLEDSRFDVNQIRFINLIIDELTKNGVVEPGRLFESPYTDYAPTGPDLYFPDADVETIVETLHHIKRTALPEDVA